MSENIKKIEDLVIELAQARVDLKIAEANAGSAANAAFRCRNALNDIQKAIDAWYAKQVQDAPDGSSWKGQRVKLL